MLGSKWQEEVAMHLDACLRFRNHCAERVDCQAGLGQRVSSSELLALIHILPERPCISYASDSFALIYEEAGRNAALKFAHWLLEYQLRLLSRFGRDLSSTTESPPYTVEAPTEGVFTPRGKSPFSGVGCRRATAWVCSVSWSWANTRNPIPSCRCSVLTCGWIQAKLRR